VFCALYPTKQLQNFLDTQRKKKNLKNAEINFYFPRNINKQ
jgi:hypothetical protein